MKSLLDLFPLLFLIHGTLKGAHGAVQCYKCTQTRPPLYSNETVRLCADFDYSNKFIVDCPFSTFCIKKYSSANIQGAINATERGCADQKYTTQNFKDGKWQPEISIEEPYREGCSTIDDKGSRTSKTEFCYCKYDLCNSGMLMLPANPLLFTFLAVIALDLL